MSEAAAPAPAAAAPSSSAAAVASSSPVQETTQTSSTQAAGMEAQAAPAKEAPKAPSAPELFEVKVDGRVIKMTRDELLQHASLGHAADRRFKEAAQMRKQAEAVIGKLRDPKSVISALQDPALGLTKEQIREQFEDWYAREFIEPEQLTPDQRKLREYEAQIKKYADDEKERQEQKEREHLDSLTSQAREEFQKQIIEALDSGTLPKTQFTLQRLAHWIKVNRANGFDAPVAVLAGQVRNEFNNTLRSMVEQSDGEVLMKLFEGTDIINKVRKYDLEQLRKSRQQPAPPVQEQPLSTESQSRRPLTSAEVTQRMRELQRTGQY